jgi:hypothetical protein
MDHEGEMIMMGLSTLFSTTTFGMDAVEDAVRRRQRVSEYEPHYAQYKTIPEEEVIGDYQSALDSGDLSPEVRRLIEARLTLN